MMLLLCSALLQILFVNGGYVDITLNNNNFKGIISLTYDGYTGFFSKISGIDSPPVCKFSYIFGMGSLNSTSTTCSDLNITEQGDSFECGAVDSIIFECKRIGRNSLCDDNKSWNVLYLNNTLIKPCAGICSAHINESISITYQDNIVTVPESACPRPTYSTSTVTPSRSAPFQVTVQSTDTDLGITATYYTRKATAVSSDATSTVNASSSTLPSQTPLIIGLCVSNGIWAFIFICVIMFLLRKRANRYSSHRTEPKTVNERKAYNEPNDYNSAYQEEISTINNHSGNNKNSKMIKPHIKMFLDLKKHGGNRDPGEDKNGAYFDEAKKKKGQDMKTQAKQSDAQTSNVQKDSSVIYVNKTVCDLSRDGISLNTAGHVYDHLTIMTKDAKSADDYYLKPTF